MGFSKRRLLAKLVVANPSQKALLAVLFAGFAGGLVGYSHISNSDVDCSTYTSASQVPAGYAVPYDVFSAAKNLLVKATCDATSATIAAGAVGDGKLVYKYGYQWRNGSWQRYTFSGTEAGLWIQDVATARLSRTSAEMTSVNYVVAYTCQSINNVWKCGCRDTQCTTGMWQLQGFKKITEALPDPNGIWGDYNELMVGYATPNAATPGSRVTLAGAGFSTKSNAVLIGNKTIKNVPADTAHSLSFTIPSDMLTGVFYVDVANDKGTTSTSSNNGAFLLVKKPGAIPPTVTSVTPASGPHGTKVTIRGTNFTPTNNYLAVGFAILKGLTSPDGKTITTTIVPFPNNPEAQKGGTPQALNKEYMFKIYVINENGISPTPVSFVTKI